MHQLCCTSFRCAPIEYTVTAMQNNAPQRQKMQNGKRTDCKTFKIESWQLTSCQTVCSIWGILIVLLMLLFILKLLWTLIRLRLMFMFMWARSETCRKLVSFRFCVSFFFDFKMQCFFVFLQFLIEHSAGDDAKMKWSLIMMQYEGRKTKVQSVLKHHPRKEKISQ